MKDRFGLEALLELNKQNKGTGSDVKQVDIAEKTGLGSSAAMSVAFTGAFFVVSALAKEGQ